MNTYQDFLKGRFQGISLDRDGRLTLAPKLETVFSSGQPTIWSIARGSGWIHLCGHRPSWARLSDHSFRREQFGLDLRSAGGFRCGRRSGWRSLCRHIAGRQGLSHRKRKGHRVLRASGQIHLVARLRQGRQLFVGAGNPGTIYRVDKSGKAETYYETGQSHVTALASAAAR